MEDRFIPPWALKNGRIDEGLFAQQFLEFCPMICVGGSFFNTEGKIRDESQLRKEIYDWISPFVSTSVAKKVTSLLEILRLECREDDLPFQEDTIHIANGTYTLADGFCPDKQICRYRLPVCYNEDAGEPKRWLSFLDSLLEPEDIETLQEYMGYALIPVTRAQKMLTLVGSGGEGKSRIGVVMKAILGENMSTGSLSKVELNAFARADLEHLLLFVDDDLKMEALSQTTI
jgi:putative DNA primase/helicase